MTSFQIITGTLTLFFAAAGFFRGLYSDKYSIDIERSSVKDDRSLWLASFTIANRSLRPIKISALDFYDDDEIVHAQDFDPAEFDYQRDELEQETEEERHKNDVPYQIGLLTNSFSPKPLHASSEYAFYNPVDVPCVVHGDSEKLFSYYFSHRPNTVIIHFDKKLILSFKWFIIPVFSSTMTITFDPERTKEP